MVNWNPVTALLITPTLEQFVSTLLCLKQSYISFLRYKRHRGRAPDVLTFLGSLSKDFFSLNTTFVNYNKPNMLKHILLNK
jgi:hypothetical protein